MDSTKDSSFPPTLWRTIALMAAIPIVSDRSKIAGWAARDWRSQVADPETAQLLDLVCTDPEAQVARPSDCFEAELDLAASTPFGEFGE